MDNIETRVFEVIAERLGVAIDRITLEHSFTGDLGADSLELVELIMALEDAIGIEIPDAESEKMFVVRDAVEFFRNHQASSAAPGLAA
jgi:acyl carrier protein